MREKYQESFGGGRYAILDKLGEGGKGDVYKALDTVLDRVVAVKVLKAGELNEETYARFQREAQAAARLTHSNVVATHDLGQEDGRYFLVMEYVDGSSLRDLLEAQAEGRLDIPTFLRLARQVCRALDYAHSHGVLHRDVKPENVMVTRDGTAKLMDFGLALALDKPRVTPSGTMVGTPAYMSPENALGKPSDARSDLYSLGALLYEMATGKPPFPQEDSLKVIYSHIHDTPVAPSRLNTDVTRALEEVILRLMAKDPGERYQSASDAAKALQHVEESLGAVEEERFMPPEGVFTARRVPTPEPRKALPIIDREAEMEVLHARVDRALRGEGSVLFLSGEAGIGKTRLAEEAAAYARLRGVRVLKGRGYPGQGAVPFAPWIEMLREFVREAPQQLLYKVTGTYASDLGKLVPELLEKVGPAPTVTLGHPEQERLRLFEAVTQLCLHISEETPLLLFLDDLNWADPASLELLHYVGRNVSHAFAMVLGAYRDVEVTEDSPLSQLLFGLNRERLLDQVSLHRLSPAHVSKMIAETFGEEEPSEDFRDLVYGKTGGNPFFVEEVLRSLVEEGVIYQADGRWDRRPVGEIQIPSSVRAVVHQRLNRLDHECSHVLARASVIGKEFDFEVLQQITGVEENRLVNLLEKAIRARIIVERPLAPGRSILEFTDSQIRDVLYDGLSLIRRRRCHLKTAESLEGLHQGMGKEAAVLAYHYVQGDDMEKALDFSLRAGEAASQVYAYEEVIRHFGSALELMEDVEHDPAIRAQVLEQRGGAMAYLGDAEAAIDHWTEAAEIYQELGHSVRHGEVLRKVAYAHFMERHDQTEAAIWYEKARTILEAEPAGTELARLYNDVARLEWRRGENPAAAVDMGEKALKLGEELAAYEEVSHALQTLAFLLPTEEKERSMEYLRKAMEIAREHDLYDPASRSFVNLGMGLAMIKGDVKGAVQTYEEGLDYVRETGYFAYRECIRAELAYSGHLLSGAWDQAADLARALQDAPVQCKLHGGLYPLVTLGLVDLYQGRWGESEERLKAALRTAESFEEATFVTPQVGLGRLYLEKGDYPEARRHLLGAYEVLKKAGNHIDYARELVQPLSLLSELSLRSENPDRAKAHWEELAGLAESLDEEWAQAHADRVRGLIALEEEDWGVSREKLRSSIQAWERLAWPFERARTLYELGIMYQRKGDREEAGATLDEALATFTELGAKTDIEKVLARKDLLKA